MFSFLWLETNKDNWDSLGSHVLKMAEPLSPKSLEDCMAEKLSPHHQPPLLTWDIHPR